MSSFNQIPSAAPTVMSPPQAPLPDVQKSKAVTQRANAREVELLLDRTPLPAPVLIPRPEHVHVMAADVDDLGEWLRALGGEIHVSPAFEGAQLWVLHTSTDPREDGSSVAVLVSVPVPVGELVMDWIRSAVRP